MNIFILDKNKRKSAQYHVDKHIVKMPLETAQLLCTARHYFNESPDSIPYRNTHTNHPCSVWVRQTRSNYIWLCLMGIELCAEYTYRYNKRHKCQDVINDCIDNIPSGMQSGNITTFVQAMDDQYKTDDPVLSYRNYYNQAKSHLHSWKNRPTPKWII